MASLGKPNELIKQKKVVEEVPYYDKVFQYLMDNWDDANLLSHAGTDTTFKEIRVTSFLVLILDYDLKDAIHNLFKIEEMVQEFEHLTREVKEEELCGCECHKD